MNKKMLIPYFPNVGIKVRGRFKVFVMQNGIIIKETPWNDNLILTQGKNKIMDGTMYWGQFSRYCCAGSSNTAPTAGDTALGSEIKRTGTYLTGAGNCGTTVVGQVVTMRRTYDFTAETGSVNYRELAWSNVATAGANINSKTLITEGGGTVSVGDTQNLRVVYDLSISFAPVGIQSGAITISGWPVSPATNTNATWALQLVNSGIVDTNGSTSGPIISGLEPAGGAASINACTALTLNSFGSSSTYTAISGSSNNSGSWSTYTPGTFTRTVTYPHMSPSSFSSTAIVGLVYGSVAFALKFDQNQTKSNSYRLRYPGYTVTIS